ncbi:MAG: AEC family transporter [Pseudomonadota bacterium]|nr:AEC family transporter [Pseudomonadota bacterium]
MLIIERILGVTLPIFAIALAGFLYTRYRKPNLSGANQISVELCLPALIFTSLSAKEFEFGQNGLLLFTSTALVLVSGIVAWPLARIAGVETRAFLPCVMFGNVGPVGIPLTVLAFGQAGLAPAVLLLVLSNILHFTVGIWVMSGRADLKSVLASPLVWSTLLGLAFSSFHLQIPAWLEVTLTLIGNILVPMMLLSLGARLAEGQSTQWRAGVIGAVGAPLVRIAVAAVLLQLLPLNGVQGGAFLMFAALPPAVFNYLLADRFGRDPEKVAAIVIAGHFASVAFLPLALLIALE